MAGWIKMPLGIEVGLGPGQIVLDGDPAPPKSGTAAPHPIFGPGLLWPNDWMDQDATWYVGRQWPGNVLDGTQLPPQKGAQQLPAFAIFGRRLCLHPYKPRPMYVVAKRLEGSG